MLNNIIMISSALVDHRGSSTGTATAMIRRERGNASCSSYKALRCQQHGQYRISERKGVELFLLAAGEDPRTGREK